MPKFKKILYGCSTKVHKRRAVFKLILRLIFSFALLGWLLARTDLSSIWTVASRLSIETIPLLVALQLLAVVVSTLRWGLLIPQHNFSLLFRLSLIGQFYSLVLPGQLAGEAMKAYRLGKGYRDAETVAASVFVDKLVGMISVLTLGLLGFYLSQLQIPHTLLMSITLSFFIVLGVLMMPSVRIFAKALSVFYGFIESRFSGMRRFVIQLRLFTSAWISYLQRPLLLLSSVLMGFGYQLVALLIILLISSRIGISIGLEEWLWVFAIVSVAVLMPLTIGGIGIREGAFVVALGFLGVPAESALAISITMFGLQAIAASIGFIFEIVGVKRLSE